jgi:beta-glucosidase
MVRIVEPGDVEVWVGSHAAASTNGLPSVGGTNGAISNTGLTVAEPVPGRATERAVLAITGDVYEPSVTDQKLVVATVS